MACNDYKGFDDTYLFEIKWPGQDAALKMQEQPIKVTFSPYFSTKTMFFHTTTFNSQNRNHLTKSR